MRSQDGYLFQVLSTADRQHCQTRQDPDICDLVSQQGEWKQPGHDQGFKIRVSCVPSMANNILQLGFASVLPDFGEGKGMGC